MAGSKQNIAVHGITDLRSCRAVIKLLKRDIALPVDLFERIKQEGKLLYTVVPLGDEPNPKRLLLAMRIGDHYVYRKSRHYES